MPIKGMTDRKLAFPEIGHIRKGAPKGEKSPGKDLTYFRVEFDERETQAAETFQRLYGDKPTDINILLPFNEIDDCWEAWLEAYTAGRMVARSDGEKYLYLVDVKTGEVVVKDATPYRPYKEGEVLGVAGKEKIIAKPAGRLKVVLPELRRLAYVTVLTTSTHDIVNITSQLQALKAVNGGIIAGIPLVLRRRPKKISTPKADGSRARYTKWMLSIEADPEWVKAKLLEVKHAALPGNGMPLLPEPEIVTEPDGDDEGFAEAEYDDEPDEIEPEPVAPNPYQTYMDRAEKDPSSAFWMLARHIGTDADTCQAIVKECGNDMTAAFAALLKQAPPMLV